MKIVSKLLAKDNFENWDEKLPISVAAYNATEHTTTQKTPNRLMMGREVSHNFDKMLPKIEDPDKIESWDDYVKAVDENTREAFQAAREATGRAVLIYKKNYDKSSHLNTYKVGDALMLKDYRCLEKGTKKFAKPYDGPYYVLDILSDVTFRVVKSRDVDPKIVHHDRMKPIEQDVKPNLDWVFQQSRTYNRQKLEQRGFDPEQMKSVTDRLTTLERQIAKGTKKALKKRAKNAPDKGEQIQNPTHDQASLPVIKPQPEKPKRGRPKKPKITGYEDDRQDDIPVNEPPATKPKRGRPKKGEEKVPSKPKRMGERRSERVKNQQK